MKLGKTRSVGGVENPRGQIQNKMAGSGVGSAIGAGSSSSAGTSASNPNQSAAPLPPKILLAKPGLVTGAPVVAAKFGRGGAGDDDTASLRSRLPPIGSLNLLSDSWDFHIDRFLPVSVVKYLSLSSR